MVEIGKLQRLAQYNNDDETRNHRDDTDTSSKARESNLRSKHSCKNEGAGSESSSKTDLEYLRSNLANRKKAEHSAGVHNIVLLIDALTILRNLRPDLKNN